MPRPNSLTITDMPNGDLGASMWMQNFARHLPQVRAALGMSPEACDEIASLVGDFERKLSIADNCMTRTKPNIEAKTLARNAAVLAIRPLVKQLKTLPGISAAHLFNLGIEPPEYAARRRKRAAARQQRSLMR